MGFKGIQKDALMNNQARQLIEELWAEVLQLSNEDISQLIDKPSLLHDAAAAGNINFLVLLIRTYPDIIWKTDENKHTIFHTAVLYRHERVFSLIYEIGAIKDLVAYYMDDNKNSTLHLAGRSADESRLNIVSGAALQMQRELPWFREVEKIVPRSFINARNLEGETPKELFTAKHSALLGRGEKWMKGMATSCMLVATLIATVVFAAAFTVPGGNSNDSGSPVFLTKKWFTIFVIADVVAFFSSTTSIIMFLSILTSRYAEKDFLISLPARLMFGLTTLFTSTVSMVMAFTSAFFLVYKNATTSMPLFIATSACVPVSLFATLHYNLLVDTICSTYWSRFLFRPGKDKIY